jgi:hypothetical protein
MFCAGTNFGLFSAANTPEGRIHNTISTVVKREIDFNDFVIFIFSSILDLFLVPFFLQAINLLTALKLAGLNISLLLLIKRLKRFIFKKKLYYAFEFRVNLKNQN